VEPQPVGKPLSLAPSDLDLAAIVTPVDVAAARAVWQQYAPPVLVDLLDAAEVPPRG
jgi:hypothetical protein